MNRRQTLAIIGSGPSCIYLLKQLLDRVEIFDQHLASIDIFEKRGIAGMGMPYNPETTDRQNMSNISSEELPELTITFADWLRGLEPWRLEEFGIDPKEISEKEVYCRLALGEYLHAQYQAIVAKLSAAGIFVLERANCKIVDVREEPEAVVLVEDQGKEFTFDRVVVATGHYWPEKDHPEAGYYVSPWPISKLLPAKGEFYNFPVGTLGASLSAFDVVSSLAHRHGTFEKHGRSLSFKPHAGAEAFSITMHSSNGLLPHLQYDQEEPMREIERHVTGQRLLALRDSQGFLRLATYFDAVCRPVLIEAFQKDDLPEIAALLENSEFGIEDFAEKMTEEHDYADAFAGMITEMKEAVESLEKRQPVHWKESIDDLMYTLNFYAELLPAEDHGVLHSLFLPFLMNVIAALPLPSARILLALHEAGRLKMVAGRVQVSDPKPGDSSTTVSVENNGEKSELTYRLFVDCSGQGPLEPERYPFPSLREAGGIREARADFADGQTLEKRPGIKKENLREADGQPCYAIGGIDIDRGYRLIGTDGVASRRLADIAFPHTSGIRPYSYGLQACNETARLFIEGWVSDLTHSAPALEKRQP